MAIRKIHVPGALPTRADAERFIDNCFDVETLRMLSARIMQQYRHVGQVRKRAFDVGDEVLFHTKRQGTVYGTIIEMLRTKVKVKVYTVHQPNGVVYRVPLTMIQRAS